MKSARPEKADLVKKTLDDCIALMNSNSAENDIAGFETKDDVVLTFYYYKNDNKVEVPVTSELCFNDLLDFFRYAAYPVPGNKSHYIYAAEPADGGNGKDVYSVASMAFDPYDPKKRFPLLITTEVKNGDPQRIVLEYVLKHILESCKEGFSFSTYENSVGMFVDDSAVPTIKADSLSLSKIREIIERYSERSSDGKLIYCIDIDKTLYSTISGKFELSVDFSKKGRQESIIFRIIRPTSSNAASQSRKTQ